MAILMRHKSTIYGLIDKLNELGDNISQLTVDRLEKTGLLANLTTAEKAEFVLVINTLKNAAGSLDSTSLKKAENLGDVADVAAARSNLDLYTIEQVITAIENSKLAMGSNYTVATIQDRDALLGLTLDDRVFVHDDGDTKWAIYKPTVFNAGVPTEWIKIADQDALQNAISNEAIRVTYEGNADTNVYVDADKAKVDLVTVTSAVDLDDVVLKAGLSQDLVATSGADLSASVDSIKAYINGAASIGGFLPAMENVVVNGSRLTLAYPPIDGVHGIANFGNVRYTDVNGVSYDAPVIATVDPTQFDVVTGTEGEWDGLTVAVQYIYTGVLEAVNVENPEAPVVALDGESGIADLPEGETIDEGGFLDQGTLPE